MAAHSQKQPQRHPAPSEVAFRVTEQPRGELPVSATEYTLDADLMPCCGRCGRQLSPDHIVIISGAHEGGWFCPGHEPAAGYEDPVARYERVLRDMTAAVEATRNG